MSKYTDISSLFTGIASAIRSKTGATNLIKADDFPDEIRNIQTTSGCQSQPFYLKEVTFKFVDNYADSYSQPFTLLCYTLDEDGCIISYMEKFEGGEEVTINLLSETGVCLSYQGGLTGYGEDRISINYSGYDFIYGFDGPDYINGMFFIAEYNGTVTVTGDYLDPDSW